MPAVSVLMAVHNGATYLDEALQSVLAQSLSDWELVVVDDGSTDRTVDILAAARDQRIRTIRLPGRSGLPTALNAGLRACTAPFIARFDADDVCAATRLEEQLDVLRSRSDLGLLGSWARVIDERGLQLGVLEPPTGTTAVLRRLRWRNALIHPSVMARRELVLRVDGYNERAFRFQDYELWLRMAGFTGLDNVSRHLVSYRVHGGQQSRGQVLPFRETKWIGTVRTGLAKDRGESTTMARMRQSVWWSAQMINNQRRDRGKIILRSVRPEGK